MDNRYDPFRYLHHRSTMFGPLATELYKLGNVLDPSATPELEHKVEALTMRLRTLTDQALSSLLEQASSRTDNELATKIASELLFAGGKRIRPLLASLAAGACGGRHQAAIPVGVATEVLHTATLLHDDVIDRSEFRRGKPTAGHQYGNTIAILSGDYCIFLALAALFPTGQLELVRRAVSTGKALVEGELLQLQAQQNPQHWSVDIYERIAIKKTASLFKFATYGGARLAGADDETTHALEQFSHHFGLAFQWIDDVLDFDEQGQSDKEMLLDAKNGVLTLPMILAREAGFETHLKAQDWKALRTCVIESGALDTVRAKAADQIETAWTYLWELPKSVYRETFEEMCRQARARIS